jgi:hypothetical protein
LSNVQRLSSSAAPDSATESAAAYCTADAEFIAAVEFTPTTKVTEYLATTEPAVIVAPVIAIPRPVVAATKAAIAVEPRTSPDENAANEIVGAVISVRRAGIWVIPIVAILAIRRRDGVPRSGNVSGTNSNAYPKSNLSVGGGNCHAREKHEKPEQTDIF